MFTVIALETVLLDHIPSYRGSHDLPGPRLIDPEKQRNEKMGLGRAERLLLLGTEAVLSDGIEKYLSYKGNDNCLFLASSTEGCGGSETLGLCLQGVWVLILCFP